jgi:hypothetical protein
MKLLRFTLFFCAFAFSITTQTSKIIDVPATQIFDRSNELGMPFSSLTLPGNTAQTIRIQPGHLFSCFGVGWAMNNHGYTAEEFTIVYRTQSPAGV